MVAGRRCRHDIMMMSLRLPEIICFEHKRACSTLSINNTEIYRYFFFASVVISHLVTFNSLEYFSCYILLTMLRKHLDVDDIVQRPRPKK